MLNIEELHELEYNIKQELDGNLLKALTLMNRTNTLDSFLELLNMQDLLKSNVASKNNKNGKIVVVGRTEVKKKELLSIAKKMGFENNRFEFYLAYDDATKLDFRKYQWNFRYAAILVGPLPYSVKLEGDFSSVLQVMKSEDGYPPVFSFGSNESKITKSNFRAKLSELIKDNIVLQKQS